MPMITIPVHAGRVTSRDPSLLQAGELTVADDVTYKPGDPGLHAAGTRAVFNSAAEGAAINGARFCEFHDAPDLIVAQVGTALRKATVGLTGAFTGISYGGAATGNLVGAVERTASATTVDSTHYGNEHAILNGVDRNVLIQSDGTAHTHGMLAASTAPTVEVTGTGQVLATGSTLTYWIEEQVRDSTTNAILKRSASSSAETVTYTGTGASVTLTVTRPAIRDSQATHWALYRTATNGSFPVGAVVVSGIIADTTLPDGLGSANPGLPTGDTYELATVTLAGTSSNFPRNGQPPIASTGDIFEDSLVTNDISDRATVRYSWPDEIHKFPACNVIKFETKELDEVVLIRSLGNFIMVGLNRAMWRINTFPRPSDAQFDGGRVKEQVCGYGVVSPLAADLFDFGTGLRLAWVSRSGVMVTDGSSWDILTDDVDWQATVEPSRYSSIRLVNNAAEYRLEMDYTPLGGTANTETMYLHYHPSHAKQGAGGGVRAKVTWPIHRAATASLRAVIDGEDRILTVNTDMKLYVEDEGLTDASGAGGRIMDVQTSEYAAPGRKTDLRVSRFWAHHSGAPSREARVSLFVGVEGQEPQEAWADIGLGIREATQAGKQGNGQHFSFRFRNADTLGPLRLNYFLADVEPMGGTRQ